MSDDFLRHPIFEFFVCDTADQELEVCLDTAQRAKHFPYIQHGMPISCLLLALSHCTDSFLR